MKTPIKGKMCHRFEELQSPGVFVWATHPGSLGNDSIHFRCPCGCDSSLSVPVTGPKAWAWNGDVQFPTLTPSIKRLDHCRWHGFLTDGEFREC